MLSSRKVERGQRTDPQNSNDYGCCCCYPAYSGASRTRCTNWNLRRQKSRTSVVVVDKDDDGSGPALAEADNWRKKRSSLRSSRSLGLSNHDSMGIPLSSWYPKAWGELSTKTVLDKSRPKTVRSFKKFPSTGKHDSRNKR